MKSNLVDIIAAIVLLIIGVICLLRPHRVQESALKGATQRTWGKYIPFLNWVKTRSYIIFVRVFGVFAIVVSILVLVTVLKLAE